jgi:phosphatidylserine/phosphatidylglycerophosphate/cardiolipin synthase-like enzyme
LPDGDLATLIAALRSGRFAQPFTGSVIERLLGHGVSSDVVEGLRGLAKLSFTEEQIAGALELVHQDRQRRPRIEDAIDLVTSGPEGLGTANRDTRIVVRELFASAQHSVLVAGYAVHQGQTVFQALADRMATVPALSVRLFLDVPRGPGDATAACLVVRRFADRFRATQWPEGRPLPEVYYDPRSLDVGSNTRSALHAKCVVIDVREFFVSSANFTEAAQDRNIEVGVLIRSCALAARLAQHFGLLVERGLLQRAL